MKWVGLTFINKENKIKQIETKQSTKYYCANFWGLYVYKEKYEKNVIQFICQFLIGILDDFFHFIQ